MNVNPFQEFESLTLRQKQGFQDFILKAFVHLLWQNCDFWRRFDAEIGKATKKSLQTVENTRKLHKFLSYMGYWNIGMAPS